MFVLHVVLFCDVHFTARVQPSSLSSQCHSSILNNHGIIQTLSMFDMYVTVRTMNRYLRLKDKISQFHILLCISEISLHAMGFILSFIDIWLRSQINDKA